MGSVRKSVAERLAGYGVWTYRGAWLLEITASIIGLATGLALGYQAFTASETTAMELVLASAPFFMVALAELTKIPVATVLFSASWVWKPVVLIFMILLAGITFETVFMGLERAATLRQLQYETLRQEIDALRFESTSLKSADDLARETDFVADAQAEVTNIANQATAARQSIQDQIDALDREIAGQLAISPEAAMAGSQLLDAKKERSELVAHQRTELEEAVRQFESQRDSFVKRIETYAQAGDQEGVRSTRSQLEALVNPRRALTEKHDAAIAPLDIRIAALQTRYDESLASSPPMSASQREELQARRQTLVQRLEQTNESWNVSLVAAQARLSDAQAAEAAKAATAAGAQTRQDQIAREVAELEKKRIPMARDDQIRRIAGRFFGQKAEDVTEEQADLVSVIWFGSLAGLAALAGPLTAVVALSLQRIAARMDSSPPESRLSKALRRAITKWRWRRTKTVDRRVEVPVEVERRVDVPVEVERVVKEILYVPVLTDDPELVLKSMSASLPPEVTEVVKTAAKRGKRGSPAQHVAS